MFEFLKLKVQIKENSLIIRKGFGRVKTATIMTQDEFGEKLKECRRAGVSGYVAAATVWDLPEGVTELKTNVKLLRGFSDGNRPALSLWYLAKYDGDTYHEILDRLKEIGCINAMQE